MTLLTFATFPPPPLLHWIKEQSSRGCLLEHLESSGTKIMNKGSIVRQLCVGRYRETNKDDPEDALLPTVQISSGQC